MGSHCIDLLERALDLVLFILFISFFLILLCLTFDIYLFYFICFRLNTTCLVVWFYLVGDCTTFAL